MSPTISATTATRSAHQIMTDPPRRPARRPADRPPIVRLERRAEADGAEDLVLAFVHAPVRGLVRVVLAQAVEHAVQGVERQLPHEIVPARLGLTPRLVGAEEQVGVEARVSVLGHVEGDDVRGPGRVAVCEVLARHGLVVDELAADFPADGAGPHTGARDVRAQGVGLRLVQRAGVVEDLDGDVGLCLVVGPRIGRAAPVRGRGRGRVGVRGVRGVRRFSGFRGGRGFRGVGRVARVCVVRRLNAGVCLRHGCCARKRGSSHPDSVSGKGEYRSAPPARESGFPRFLDVRRNGWDAYSGGATGSGRCVFGIHS